MNDDRIKSTIQAFYHGGAKVEAALSVEREVAAALIREAWKNHMDAELPTVPNDRSVESETLFLTRRNLLFYAIFYMKPEAVVQEKDKRIILSPRDHQ